MAGMEVMDAVLEEYRQRTGDPLPEIDEGRKAELLEAVMEMMGWELSYDARRTGDKDVLCMIEGKPFRCECGCNVFRKLLKEPHKYVCNSCGAVYTGVKG